MSATLPTGSSYGSQILTSGDICVGSLSARNRYAVYRTDELSSQAKASHLAYVNDATDGTLTECSRINNEENAGVGQFSIGVLSTSDTVQTLLKTFKSEPTATAISNAYTTATFGERGLSFDSDNCAIYFGRDKTFRIMLNQGDPARLVFQCLDEATGEYVTKFCCVK